MPSDFSPSAPCAGTLHAATGASQLTARRLAVGGITKDLGSEATQVRTLSANLAAIPAPMSTLADRSRGTTPSRIRRHHRSPAPGRHSVAPRRPSCYLHVLVAPYPGLRSLPRSPLCARAP